MTTKTPTPTKDDFATASRLIATASRFTVATACSVLNRESKKGGFELPADGWSMLVPMGEFPGEAILPDGSKKQVIQVFDKQALDTIAAEFSGEDLLIDYEHFSHDPDKATNAGGWFREIEVRDDGIYSRNRYSAQGRADVEGGNYRYISPEFDAIEVIEGNRVRPRKLSGAALTNRPALKTLKPLSNRESTKPTQEDKTMSKLIAVLAPFLALSAEADEATVLNRLSALPKDATLDDLLADKAEVVELRNRHQELLDAQIEVDLDRFEAEGVIHDRASVKAMLLHNREGTLKMLEGLKPAKQDVPARVFNRGAAKAPAKSVEDLNREFDAKAEARAARINNRAKSIMAEQKCGFTTAWAQAEQEEPATEG